VIQQVYLDLCTNRLCDSSIRKTCISAMVSYYRYANCIQTVTMLQVLSYAGNHASVCYKQQDSLANPAKTAQLLCKAVNSINNFASHTMRWLLMLVLYLYCSAVLPAMPLYCSSFSSTTIMYTGTSPCAITAIALHRTLNHSTSATRTWSIAVAVAMHHHGCHCHEFNSAQLCC
jgi:hypothetical protein